MESDVLNESYNDFESYDVSRIVRLQALTRGVLVRRQMKSLRDVYLGIVNSIESNKQLSVSWKGNTLSRPKFNKHKRQIKTAKTKEHETNFLKQNEVDSRVCQKSVETNTSETDRKMISVEIQTNGEVTLSSQVDPSTEDPNTARSHADNTEKVSIDGNKMDSAMQTSSIQSVADLTCEEPVKLVQENVENDTVVKTVDSVELVDPVVGHQDVDESDTSSLTEVTSIWESQLDSKAKPEEIKNINSSSILEVRKNIAMELLWVQQAINSRKNYLRLKSQME